MIPWLIALILKPFIGIVILAVLWFGAKGVAWCLFRIIPDCSVKRYLFRGWHSPTNGTGLVK
jgi:hypothetical protein